MLLPLAELDVAGEEGADVKSLALHVVVHKHAGTRGSEEQARLVSLYKHSVQMPYLRSCNLA